MGLKQFPLKQQCSNGFPELKSIHLKVRIPIKSKKEVLKIQKERYSHLWFSTRFCFWAMVIFWEIEILRVFNILITYKRPPLDFYFYIDLLDIDVKLVFFTTLVFFLSVIHLVAYREKNFVEKIFVTSTFFLVPIVTKFGGFIMLVPFSLILFSMIYWLKKKRERRVIMV